MGFLISSFNGFKNRELFAKLNRFGFEFSLSSLMANGFGGGRGEKRKLSASRPAMSSQELMTSGSERRGLGSDRRDLDSESGVGKMEPRVNLEGGVEGAVVD